MRSNLSSQSLHLPLNSFDSQYHSQPLRVYQLLSESQAAFPQGIKQWEFLSEQHERVLNLSATGPAVSGDSTLGIDNSRGAPFQLFSVETFAPKVDGWLVLAYAKTEPKSFVQMYERKGVTPIRHHLFKTASWPAVIRGKDGNVWHLEAYLLPAIANVQYGVYVLGGEMPWQQFGDLVCFFFPAKIN